ncbi:MAG: T9SS type A sorting domain-containing protein, partial [Bacteroidetes bacterium]|nr:T9SS type A sorting domain-containing protein [Bacteroidota bacterium]
TTYYLHVRANCGTPNYSAWVTIPFTTLTPCSDPTGLAANNITTTSADLSWNTVATAFNYEYIIDQNAATPAVPGTITAFTTYSAIGLTAATAYYLHVRANCGTPNYSAWVTIPFTTLTPCPDPTGLAANNLTTTSADLSWNTIATALNYEYIVDQDPVTPAVPGTISVSPLYIATGLTPATTYYLHVRANCGTPNYSAWITMSFTTLTPCPDPTGLAATNITTTAADLGWNTIATALNYEYIVDQDPASPAVPGTITATPSYSATGLTAGTTYYLHVRANCGTPNYSAWVTVSFTTIPQCADPTGLTASMITNTSALLSWDSLVGPSYEYVVDQSAAAPVVPGTAQTNTRFTATALAPAVTYYLHVRTDCGGGNFSNWITMPFTTLGTPGNILIGWDVNGLNDYGPSPYSPTVAPPTAFVTAGGLTRAANISVPAQPAQAIDNAWGGMNFYGAGGPYVPNALQDCIDNNAFLYFKIKSQPGYTVSLSTFDMFFGRYGLASPSGVTVQYGIDSANFVDLATAVHPDTPVNARYAFPTLDLSGIAALQQVTSGHTIYFRIVPVQSHNDSATAAWFIYNGNNDPLLYQGSDIFLRGNWDVALPLQLLSFTGFAGKSATDGNILNWTTANEQGIRDFGLERSYDAKVFDKIANLSPKSNTISNAVYQYIDKTAGSARSFYRLKITDLNGSYRYSDVVEITKHSNSNIALYPNPVHDKLYISTGNANVEVVRITDMIGKTWDVKASAQPGMLTLDVSGLPNAVYTLQLSGAGMNKPRALSFVKQ